MSGRACDFCKAANAPFGFAPPPGSGIQVRRPIWTCADPGCRKKAEDRRAQLIKNHDPFARKTGPRPAHDCAPVQGSLFTGA